MKITYKNAAKLTKKFLEGGPVEPAEQPVTEPAPEEAAPEAPQDPMMQLAQIFAQGLQNQDCEMLAQGAQMFLQLVQQAQGGAPEEAGEPVYKKGGKLAYRIKK